MLDDEERTVLEETEKALALDDPQLARRMRRPGRGRARHAAVSAVTVVLVAGLCWLALPGQALLVVLVGLGVLVATGWRPTGRHRAGPGPRERPPAS